LQAAKNGVHRSGTRLPRYRREDFVNRIAAKCTSVDERSVVGIRLQRDAAIVRQYAE
jgi:hypothetical protein